MIIDHRHRPAQRRFAAVLAALSLFGHALAQPTPSLVDPETQIKLSGQIELARLVDTAAQHQHVLIQYDPAIVKGVVTIRQPFVMNADELWDFTNRVLAERGLTTVLHHRAIAPAPQLPRSQPSFGVVKLPEAAALAPLSDEHFAAVPAPGFQSVLLPTLYRAPKDLSEQLSRLTGRAPGSGTITPLGDSRVLVVSDLTPRITQIRALLARLDTPDASTTVRDYPLRNLTGPALVPLMNQVAAKREAVSGVKLAGEVLAGPDIGSVLIIAPEAAMEAWTELVVLLDRREPVETVSYSPRHFALADVARLIGETIGPDRAPTPPGTHAPELSWRVVADDLTGSLVITATASQHQAIRELINRLDSVPASARRPVRTFVIRNRPIDEVVSILTDLLRDGSLDQSSGGVSAAPSAFPVPSLAAPPPTSSSVPAVSSMPPPPLATSPPASTPLSDPRPSSSPAANSSAHAAAVTDGPPVTFTIDKGTSTLIAIGEPRTLDQIAALLKTLDVRQPQVMLEVLLVTLSDGQTMDLGVELEKLQVSGGTLIRLSSLFGLGSRGQGGDRDGPANASGFTGVVLNPGDFSIVLRALETLNQGRAVSMPKLLVGNNEQATLDSVVQQPFASVNASNTVSTTSFGGTQDAGTVVTIQPQIAEGDHLLLQYSVSLSAFLGPASSPTLPPPRQQNRVQSVATIPDGYTVVVGGIEITNKSQAVSQIPLLGSIPILGEAFKSRSKTDSKSTFYVFIRANVLRHGGFEDLKHLSETDVAKAGIDDRWPELKPRVIR